MQLQQQVQSSMATKRHVAVVGAGFAGLAAARTLLAEGRGQVEVTILEADSVVGGRARRGQLRSGPVEMGATWFHGTEGNPVYDYAVKLSSGSASHSSQQANKPVDRPKDTTANANGSDPRWELQLVAPGQQAPLSGPRHQAILAAFEQYSTAVEDIAADAEAAAAAAVRAGATTHGSSDSTSDGADVAAADRSAVPGCSLGQILRARFDDIMSAADTSSASAQASGQDVQQQEQQAPEAAAGEPAGVREVAAWLASDATGLLKESFAEGWGCRERLQRAYDGFHSSDVAGLAHITEYNDLDGPNIPVPGGYQSIAEALAAEAQGLGLKLHLNCPVETLNWARPDSKVRITLQPTTAADDLIRSSSSAASSSSSISSSSELLFDACVLTCSLGVLKTTAATLFQPQLPPSKVQAIQQLHIGQVEKLFVEWPPATPDNQQVQAAGTAAQPGHPPQRSAAPAQDTAASHVQQQQQQAIVGAAGAAAAPRVQPSALVGPRKPKPQQLHDVAPPGQAAAAAAAATATAHAAGAAPSAGFPAASESSGSSSAAGAAEGDDPYTTYCLMWPTQQRVWGKTGSAQQCQDQQQHTLPMDIPLTDPVYFQADTCGAAAEVAAPVVGNVSSGVQHKEQQQQQQLQELRHLPEWLFGLHSWRYGDGPEWIKPASGLQVTTSSNVGSSEQQQQQQQQPASRSAVIWVTGRAAQQMGQLSDQQVLQDLGLLLQTYPAIPRPDDTSAGGDSNTTGSRASCSLEGCTLLRSTWTTSSNFRGSYSYPSPQADGSTADALAAPLTAADAEVTGDAGSSRSSLRVCFAGEATSREHMGTVHGAFNSGVREADRLLSSWGIAQPAAATSAAAGAEDAQAPAEYHAAFWL